MHFNLCICLSHLIKGNLPTHLFCIRCGHLTSWDWKFPKFMLDRSNHQKQRPMKWCEIGKLDMTLKMVCICYQCCVINWISKVPLISVFLKNKLNIQRILNSNSLKKNQNPIKYGLSYFKNLKKNIVMWCWRSCYISMFPCSHEKIFWWDRSRKFKKHKRGKGQIRKIPKKARRKEWSKEKEEEVPILVCSRTPLGYCPRATLPQGNSLKWEPPLQQKAKAWDICNIHK